MTAQAIQYQASQTRWGPVSTFGHSQVSAVPTVSEEPEVVGAGSDAHGLDEVRSLLEELLDRNLRRIHAQAEAPRFSWLPEVYVFVAGNRDDDAIDLLFDNVDDLLIEERFNDVDDLLRALDPKRLNTTVMLATLSITKPASEKLPSREHLLERVEQLIGIAEPDRVERLLSGLR